MSYCRKHLPEFIGLLTTKVHTLLHIYGDTVFKNLRQVKISIYFPNNLTFHYETKDGTGDYTKRIWQKYSNANPYDVKPMTTINTVLGDVHNIILSGQKIEKITVMYACHKPISMKLREEFGKAGYKCDNRYLTQEVKVYHPKKN